MAGQDHRGDLVTRQAHHDSRLGDRAIPEAPGARNRTAFVALLGECMTQPVVHEVHRDHPRGEGCALTAPRERVETRHDRLAREAIQLAQRTWEGGGQSAQARAQVRRILTACVGVAQGEDLDVLGAQARGGFFGGVMMHVERGGSSGVCTVSARDPRISGTYATVSDPRQNL